MHPTFLIVGLGNPGWRYRRTRHNIGFMVLDEFRKRERVRFRSKDGPFISAQVNVGDEVLLLVKPTTFMNASGRALRWLFDSFDVPLDRILVLCDDIDLPLGKMRLRRKGSDGGHRGLSSIVEALGTIEFPRLRFGIGRPDGETVVNYVLSGFSRGDKKSARRMIEEGNKAIRDFVIHGIDRAMNTVNTGRINS